MQKATFFDRKGRGEGTGLLRVNRAVGFKRKGRLVEAGRPFFGTNGTLLSYDRTNRYIGAGTYWEDGDFSFLRP